MEASFTLAGFEIAIPVLTLGVIVGMTYGILAVGLVLVYRSNRIINFAHGEIGAFGAAVLGLVVTRWGVPYWLAFLLALTAAAAVGALAEVAVIRRLRNAPRLMSIVATLGVGQFLLLFSIAMNDEALAGGLYPLPPFLPTFSVGVLTVTRAHFGMLVLTPLLVLALGYFLRRTRYGLAIQGAAANPDAARLTGVFAGRMSSLVWAIAGIVSAFTAIMFSPTRGFIVGESFGPGLLLRALVAAVIARMTSLPVALAAGVGVGVVEQSLLWNYPRGGLVEAVLFGVIVVALLTQRRSDVSREDKLGSWAAVQPWPPLPEAFRQVWAVRNLGHILGVAALVVALPLVWTVTSGNALVLVGIVSLTIVGLSVGVVTGLAGQLTLGQFAVAGVGAAVSVQVVAATGSFVLGFTAAAVAAALASVLIGLPALRIRGLMLAVTTLGFALATQAWLLQQPWMIGEGSDPGRPRIAGATIETTKGYFLFALAMLVIAIWFARNIRRGGLGRRMIAIRDNEDNARAFTIPSTRVKLQGFALAGVIAGFGGAVFGHSLSRISTIAFPVARSVDVVAMAVIGGIGLLAGPLLGALYILGIPEFLPLDSAMLAASSFGWLLLILYAPGGISQLVRPLRDRLIDRLARRAGLDPTAVRAREDAPESDNRDGVGVLPERTSTLTVRPGEVLLEAHGLVRHYGGVHAVDGVDLQVHRGEIVGLIGPNGAGKTTLFELLGGFNPLDAGRITYAGEDVTALGPEARARRGLIRSFQDAALFPTMTVLDVVQLALERVDPTRSSLELVGLRTQERRREERAREIVAALRLERYRNRQIRELSTGTRRIAEFACLIALEPELLLLDEPSSGIAQRETEALGRLLADLRERLDVTMVVIEHDIPLIMGLADRIVVMDSGRVIAEGEPDVVRRDPRVVESYLGGDPAAIQRSGVRAADAHDDELARVLAEVPGLGPARRRAITDRFGALSALRAATRPDLLTIPGIGEVVADRIVERLETNGRHPADRTPATEEVAP